MELQHIDNLYEAKIVIYAYRKKVRTLQRTILILVGVLFINMLGVVLMVIK